MVFSLINLLGSNGHLVSNFISSHLVMYFSEYLAATQKPKDSLYRAYKRVFEELVIGNVDVTFSGSTAVTCFISKSTIYTANTGDSRAVIGSMDSNSNVWSAHALTTDHKPDLPLEQARIEKKGGRVEPCLDHQNNYIGPARVWLAHEHIPGLAMSRSIGDLVGASVGVTWEPDITVAKVKKSDRFMIVASDGVWEFMSDIQVVKIVGESWKKGDIEGASDRLLEEALLRWELEEEGNVDDITFTLIFFNQT